MKQNFFGKIRELFSDNSSQNNTQLADPKLELSAKDVITEAYPNISFNLENIESQKSLSGVNLDIFNNSYKIVLSLIFEALTLECGFPETNYGINKVQILPMLERPEQDYTRLILNKPTPTGKAPKFPVRIRFYCKRNSNTASAKNDFFGDLDYYSTGALGKARLIRWVNSKCYIIKASEKSGQLSVQRIDMHGIEGKEINLYIRN